MMKALAQLSIAQWPVSLTEEVVVLKQEPNDFEQTSILKFEETFDDLDYFKAAIAVSLTGRVFALKRYANCPSPGVSLLVNKDNSEGLFAQILDALHSLGISRNSVTWTRIDLENQMSQP